MARSRLRSLRLSDKDLDFLVETVSPGVIDKPKLKQILREDEKFRNTFIDDEKVFRRLMDDEWKGEDEFGRLRKGRPKIL